MSSYYEDLMEQKVTEAPWKTATSYPDAPHQYIVRDWCPDIHQYMSTKIRMEGVLEPFTLRGKTFTYRYFYRGDGYKYWHMGTVINRARPDGSAPGESGPMGADQPSPSQ